MNTRRKLALGAMAVAIAAPIFWFAWWLRGTSPQHRQRGCVR